LSFGKTAQGHDSRPCNMLHSLFVCYSF
jgi:hypothetical protein